MDQKLIEKVTKQVIDFISSTMADELCGIVSPFITDEAELEQVTSAIKNKMKTVSDSIPKAAARASTSRSTTSKDTLKDKDGNDIICAGVIKKSGAQCGNKAKHEVDGQFYCGRHNKRGTGSIADPNKRPSVKEPAKATSSFTSIINGDTAVPDGTDIDYGSVDDITY